jgi:hypothetical protein
MSLGDSVPCLPRASVTNRCHTRRNILTKHQKPHNDDFLESIGRLPGTCILVLVSNIEKNLWCPAFYCNFDKAVTSKALHVDIKGIKLQSIVAMYRIGFALFYLSTVWLCHYSLAFSTPRSRQDSTSSPKVFSSQLVHPREG